MTDLERERERETKDGVRQNERDGEIRLVAVKRTTYCCCKIYTKGERKGVRHAEKKRLREGERESKGKNNEKIESFIVRQNK